MLECLKPCVYLLFIYSMNVHISYYICTCIYVIIILLETVLFVLVFRVYVRRYVCAVHLRLYVECMFVILMLFFFDIIFLFYSLFDFPRFLKKW